MKTTIYIRQEDEPLWEEIENKSQWVADMLNGNETDLEKRIRRVVEQELNEREKNYG